MKDELAGGQMKEPVDPRAKTYSVLMDNGREIEKQRNKKCVIEKELRHQNYKNFLLNNEIILKSQQRFKYESRSYVQKKSIRFH